MSTTRVLLAEAVRSPELVKEALDDLQTDEDAITRWVRAAAADGRLAVADPELGAEQFISLLEGALFWPQVFGCCPIAKKAKRATIVNWAVRMFLDHYEA